MVVVKEYGGVTAVLVGNTRKAMTIALSFIVFPKVIDDSATLSFEVPFMIIIPSRFGL